MYNTLNDNIENALYTLETYPNIPCSITHFKYLCSLIDSIAFVEHCQNVPMPQRQALMWLENLATECANRGITHEMVRPSNYGFTRANWQTFSDAFSSR